MHLIDNPLPHCFQCKAKGHFAQNCPDKKVSQTDTTLNPTFSTGVQNFRRSRPQASQQHAAGYNQQPAQRFPQFAIQQPVQQPPQQPVQQQVVQQQRMPAQAKPCYRYNGTGFCAKPPCQFLHICSICYREGHPAKDCYANSSSTFRPGSQPGSNNGQG